MVGIPENFYSLCRDVLLQCSEFDSNASLRAIFVTDKLIPFRDGLPEATSKNERVALCLDYLQQKHSSDREPIFPIFLEVLCARQAEGDALRDQLNECVEVARQIKWEEINNGRATTNKTTLLSPGKKTLLVPDAGFDKPSRLSPIPAFSLNPSSAAFEWMPFDIGTIWGLERGSFIGIIAGFEADRVYESLISVERVLYDAVMLERSSTSLPTRWWIRIDPSQHPPQTAEAQEVWESVVEPHNPLVQFLTNQGLPDFTIPGIFFEVSSEKFDDALSVSIQYWCEVLIKNIFPSHQVAIVIHVIDTDNTSIEIILKTKAQLEKINLKTPIEPMILKDMYGRDYQGQCSEYEESSYKQTLLKGIHFFSWIHQVHNKPELRIKMKQKEEYYKYNVVLDVYKQYQQEFEENTWLSYAWEVISDLDAIAYSRDNKIYRQFLEFVEKYLPERLYELVEAYPRSSNREARRQALLFARSHGDIISDILMDAWVEGSELKPERIPQGAELYPDPHPFVDELIFAILRQLPRKTKQVEGIITGENLQPVIKELLPVCNFCLGKTKEESFLEEAKPRDIRYAIRSGAEINLALNQFKNCELDNSVFCRVLAAKPPRLDLIRELLKLGKERRAFFGLCTAEEWQQLKLDSEVADQICEGQRLLMSCH